MMAASNCMGKGKSASSSNSVSGGIALRGHLCTAASNLPRHFQVRSSCDCTALISWMDRYSCMLSNVCFLCLILRLLNTRTPRASCPLLVDDFHSIHRPNGPSLSPQEFDEHGQQRHAQHPLPYSAYTVPRFWWTICK